MLLLNQKNSTEMFGNPSYCLLKNTRDDAYSILQVSYRCDDRNRQ